MNKTTAVLGAAGVLLLGGCMMMGGLGHAHGLAGMQVTRHLETGRTTGLQERAEASSGDFTITLSFPAPTRGSTRTISALLRSDRGDRESTDEAVLLRIQTPGGSVDELPMQGYPSPGGRIYQTQYRFETSGLYVLTADARARAGEDMPTVSVTIRAAVGTEADSHWHGGRRLQPSFAGLGMVVMMGGSVF